MVETHSSNPKDCVLFSTADWDTPYWTNKQHTAHHLALKGFRVLYIESIGIRAPTFNGQDLRRMWQRLKRGLRPAKLVEPNVWVMSPLAIPFKQHWPLVRAFNQGWLCARIKVFMVAHSFNKPLVWTYHPFMLGVVSKLNCGPLVYHCVDDLSAVPGVDSDAFNAEERKLLGECNAVFVTSEALRNKCAPFNSNTHYFPNVVDLEHFAQARKNGPIPKDLEAIPTPRIGYVGALSDFKVDFALIQSVATARPDWHWVVIGAEREGQHSPLVDALRALPNVHFLGDKPYADLPDYLRGFDVGTLPTLINDYTRSMFPMKYFEYLAAGVPVVSTPLEFTKTNQAGSLVADTSEQFKVQKNAQLARGRLTVLESREFVGDNTWAARLKKMLELLFAHP
jgi:glycosyltransferase involved in cell wall biosynthesis